MTFRRWLVLSLSCAAILVVGSLPGLLNAWTGWPSEPLILAVALSTAAALATQRRRVAFAMVVLWAIVACPFPITTVDGGFAKTAPGAVRAAGLDGADAVTSGAHLVDAGGVAAGTLLLSRDQLIYLNGEGSYPDSELVAWAVGWLPYPHVQRTVVQQLGGNSIDHWSDTDDVQLREDGHRTVLVGRRDDGTGQSYELRPVVMALTHSKLTFAGWALILIAAGYGMLAGRLTAPSSRG